VTAPKPYFPRPHTRVPAGSVLVYGIEDLAAWTTMEMAELMRAERALRCAGLMPELEFGTRADSSPWCVVWLMGSEIATACLSRLGERYLVDWSGLPAAFEVNDLRAAVERLLDAAVRRCTH
jgi:hypothetical protein